MLKIFAYGTFQEYQERAADLGEISEAAATKLKMLTIVALAGSSRIISYATLLAELDLGEVCPYFVLSLISAW